MEGFNEAAARGGGKDVRKQVRVPVIAASMRPPHAAAEKRTCSDWSLLVVAGFNEAAARGGGKGSRAARPGSAPSCFNEAAARGGGKGKWRATTK